MTESMDAADYAFYLAYGMTQQDESLDSLLDVEMYNIIDADSSAQLEACHRNVLERDTPQTQVTCPQL